jgi:aryl-alcohol dehydrogenase-like predicted oxidoreductase
MDYRTLGNSGCAVSSLCLGTMTFGVKTGGPALGVAGPVTLQPRYSLLAREIEWDYPYGELGVDQRSRSLGGS